VLKTVCEAKFFINSEHKMSTKMTSLFKYSTCDLICGIISCCVRSCDTDKINVYDRIVIRNCKKRVNMESKIFLHKPPSKRWFRNGFHSLLRRADARGSADIIYRIWRISLLCGSGI